MDKSILTSTEKVLFKAEVYFNVNTLKMTIEEAETKAFNKITRVRRLTNDPSVLRK